MEKTFLSTNRNWRKLIPVAAVAFLSHATCVTGQPTLVFNKMIGGLSSPVDIKNAADGSGRIFIVEQPGTIRIYKNGSLLSKPFLDVTGIVRYRGGEQGLLSIAFPPGFKTSGYFYIYYTATNENVTLARYRVKATNPNVADPASGVILFSYPKPGGYGNHNGGTLQFGKDNYLYVSIGDGGSEGDPNNNGQNGQSPFGKMFRLDVNKQQPPYYRIPPDNPFINDPTVLDEIWSLGLRNPWKWSFDRKTGDTWIGDVGQDTWEEIDFKRPAQAAGANYGWRCYEGHAAFNLDGCKSKNQYDFPIFDYKHGASNGGDCVIGGYVYRGSKYPQLKGYYLCADYISPTAWKIIPNGSGGWNVYVQKNVPQGIVSFGEDESGELYASTLGGNVYHIEASNTSASSTPVTRDLTGSIVSFIYPTLVTNGIITVALNAPYRYLRVVDIDGKEVLQKDIKGLSGKINVQLPVLNDGTYIVQLIDNTTTMEQKIYVAH